MKNYVYVGTCFTKRGRCAVSVKIVQHASDKDAVGGVLEYAENVSADVDAILIFDALEDQLICEVQL